MTEKRLWLSLVEAAEMTGLHTETLRRHVKTGKLPGRKIGGRWMIPRASLVPTEPADDWLEWIAEEIVRARREGRGPTTVAEFMRQAAEAEREASGYKQAALVKGPEGQDAE